VVGEFLDILTGTDNSRPELAKAIDLAKREKATSGFRTFGAECLVSGGKPTVF